MREELANFDVATCIDDFCAKVPRQRILDLGGRSGNHLDLYARNVGPSGRVIGIDRERRLVEAAREARRAIPEVDVLVGSIDDPLPFPDGSFGLCFSNLEGSMSRRCS